VGHDARDDSVQGDVAGPRGSHRRPAKTSTFCPMDDSGICGAIGEAGQARLAGAFYAQVSGDEVLSPMYPPDDLAGAEERLRHFLVGRFGGPRRYVERRGHPRLRARQLPLRQPRQESAGTVACP